MAIVFFAGVILSVKMDADKKLNAQKVLRAKAEEEVQKLTEKVEQLQVSIVEFRYIYIYPNPMKAKLENKEYCNKNEFCTYAQSISLE